MSNEIRYVLLGFLGLIFHSLLKYQSLRADAMAANKTLSLLDYINKDWVGIVLSVIPIIIWLFTFGEAAQKYPSLQNYVYTSFAVIGALGSYLFQLVLSRSKKQFRSTIDVQSDLADMADEDTVRQVIDNKRIK